MPLKMEIKPPGKWEGPPPHMSEVGPGYDKPMMMDADPEPSKMSIQTTDAGPRMDVRPPYTTRSLVEQGPNPPGREQRMTELPPGYRPIMRVIGMSQYPPFPQPTAEFVPPNPTRLSIAPPVVIRAQFVDPDPIGKSEVGTGYEQHMSKVPTGYQPFLSRRTLSFDS